MELTPQMTGPRMRLSDLLPGDRYAEWRKAIVATGYVTQGQSTVMVKTRPLDDGDHEVLAMAAVARDPGRSVDYLDTIQDYQNAGKRTKTDIERYWRLYYSEGILNNAINKIAAVLSTGGSFKVRGGRKGKLRKPDVVLEQLLHWWQRNVNASAMDGVVTGARGLKAVTHQGVRQALVEGSWIGRTVWTKAEVGKLGRFDLPMNIQALSVGAIEPVTQLQGTGIELFYWLPNSNLLKELRSPSNKDVKKLVETYVPKDLQKTLRRDTKVLLDPALLLHVKHRGNDRESFGESFIAPAVQAIAFKQAVDQLDLVSMQSLINRLVIVMVGSDDPASPYSKTDVAQARQALLQSLLTEPGPNMLLIWAGNDISVKDVGAHSSVLDLNERHKIAEAKIKIALGVPEAFLSGTMSDGKASGLAAMLGAAAEMEELRNAFAQAWTTLGERIALDNGFEDVDLVYEFDNNLMVDKEAERTQNRLDYSAGLMSIRATVAAAGRDPNAEYLLKCQEKGLTPGTATWEEAFAPPQGLPGQGAPGQGRVPDSQNDTPEPDRPPESRTTEENK